MFLGLCCINQRILMNFGRLDKLSNKEHKSPMKWNKINLLDHLIVVISLTKRRIAIIITVHTITASTIDILNMVIAILRTMRTQFLHQILESTRATKRSKMFSFSHLDTSILWRISFIRHRITFYRLAAEKRASEIWQ